MKAGRKGRSNLDFRASEGRPAAHAVSLRIVRQALGSAREFVILASACGCAPALSREAATRSNGAQAVTNEIEQIVDQCLAGLEQQRHQSVFEIRHTLCKVGFVAVLALTMALIDQRLLQVLHQQGQIFE